MLDSADIKDLQDRFDNRYKLREDCDRDMDAVAKVVHQQDVDLALINQQLKIIKWVSMTTLGAVIGAIVVYLFAKFVGG